MTWIDELHSVVSTNWSAGDEIDLEEIYALEPHFEQLHPGNYHIQAKLRQTLQNLRGGGVIEFLGKGRYRVLPSPHLDPQIRLDALWWRRIDQTTWNVLMGAKTQASGGSNHHVAASPGLPIERVIGELDPPSTPEARVEGKTLAYVTLPGGALRELEVAVNLRGADGPSPRLEILIRRQFGSANALPLWHAAASSLSSAPTKNATAEQQPLIYLARGDDGSIIHGWASPAEIASWPAALKSQIEGQGGQGIAVLDRPTGQGAKLSEVFDGLDKERNVLLYGPPGTGKTFLMTAIWAAFRDGWRGTNLRPSGSPQATTAPLADRWATFHPSYSYETFVAGFTPAPAGQGFSLKSSPGPALEASEAARQGGTGLLMIDELNRGNASRIFGELITVLELDKRLTDSGSQRPTTIPVRLANVDASTSVDTPTGPSMVPVPFEMPSRVYMVGSMNSVDRTVAPLDAAVRRRFRVVELRPDPSALAIRLGAGTIPVSPLISVEDWAGLTVKLMEAINRRLAHLAGPDFAIGHGYFWQLGDSESAEDFRAALVTVWNEKVYPQLEETFRTRPDALAGAVRLGAGQKPPAGFPYSSVSAPADLEELGGTAFVQAVAWSGDAIHHESWLRYLAEAELQASPPTTAAPGIPTATEGIELTQESPAENQETGEEPEANLDVAPADSLAPGTQDPAENANGAATQDDGEHQSG